MSHSLYYGEIAAKISANLHKNPDNIKRISKVISSDPEYDYTIYTLSADAAKVFDKIEDLSDEHFIDWHRALNKYADEVKDHLLLGNVPNMIELVSIASRSIQTVH